MFGSCLVAVSSCGSISPARIRPSLRCWTHLFLGLHRHRMERHSSWSQTCNQMQIVDEDRQVRKYDGTTTEGRPSPDLDWRHWKTMEHHSPRCLTGDGRAWSQGQHQQEGFRSGLSSEPLHLASWHGHGFSQCDLQQVWVMVKERREARLQGEKWIFNGSFFPAAPGVEWQEIPGCLL